MREEEGKTGDPYPRGTMEVAMVTCYGGTLYWWEHVAAAGGGGEVRWTPPGIATDSTWEISESLHGLST